jgi:hypothetical protein
MTLRLTLIFILLVALPVTAAPLLLVTQDEMLQSNAANLLYIARVAPPPNAPVIDLLIPKLDGPIGSPTPIAFRFTTKEPARVKVETFKVFYGTFQIDITNRLLAVAQVTEQGVSLKEAALPKGNHKILLNVEDSEGRVGAKFIELEIR